MRAPRRPRGDRGSFALELVILAPLLLVLTLAVLAAGRYTTAQQAVSDAAREAARAATLDGGTGTVADQAGAGTGGDTSGASIDSATQQAADGAASADLDQHDLHCAVTGGNAASLQAVTATDQLGGLTLTDLRATVTCSLELSDLGFPGLPGHVTITEHATSAEDPLRGTAAGGTS